jgi:hypothetical protein
MTSIRRLALYLGALLPAVLAAPASISKLASVPDKYIITLKPDSSDAKVEAHLSWVEGVHRRSLAKRDTSGVEKTFNISSWSAYSGEFDKATIDEIKKSPEVNLLVRST